MLHIKKGCSVIQSEISEIKFQKKTTHFHKNFCGMKVEEKLDQPLISMQAIRSGSNEI